MFQIINSSEPHQRSQTLQSFVFTCVSQVFVLWSLFVRVLFTILQSLHQATLLMRIKKVRKFCLVLEHCYCMSQTLCYNIPHLQTSMKGLQHSAINGKYSGLQDLLFGYM